MMAAKKTAVAPEDDPIEELKRIILELKAEVAKLRAEVARQVPIPMVPMPFPVPYPVPAWPQPWYPRPWIPNPNYYGNPIETWSVTNGTEFNTGITFNG